MTKDANISLEYIREAFQKIWGYEDFRPPQGEIIDSLLRGKDALIIMPTGGGKSICFQLPALLKNGVTLVISPLVALMENQVKELLDRNLPAALIHSQILVAKRRQTLQALEKNKLRLLYLSPETLLSKPVWEILIKPDVIINGLILDEAHCLVQWGDTFRPAYRRLGMVRSSLLKAKGGQGKIAIAAFTATANPQARSLIKNVLNLVEPESFLINPYRSNLDLKVQRVCTPRGRRQQLLNLIKRYPKQSGIVYVRSRRDSEELSSWLKDQGYDNAAYHAGLGAEIRREIESNWLNDRIPFVVSTSAFGMGINKSDVRWVIHYQAPLLLSEYIQEVGRGGRDGKRTVALTLVSEPTGWLDDTDKQMRAFFVKQLQTQLADAKKLAKKLPKKGNIESITQAFPEGAISLSILHSQGQLTWEDPFNYVMNKSANLGSCQQLNDQAVKEMISYLNTRQCRWQFLLTAFGFAEVAKNMRCGHCDNCR